MADEGDDKVIIVIEDKRIPASKSTLVKTSPYFEAMFMNPNFAENSMPEVRLNCMNEDAVESLIHFCSGEGIQPNDQNVFEIMQAAGLLQISEATKICAHHLKDSLKYSNALEIFEKCDFLHVEEVTALAKRVILWNFDKVFKSDFRNQLELSTLVNLLQHEKLNVSKEASVVSVIRDWCSINKPESDKVMKLLRCLRHDALDPETLENLCQEEFIRAHPDCLDYVTKMVKHSPELPLVPPRKQRIVPCVVGITSKTSPDFVMYFDRDTREIVPLIPLLHSFIDNQKALGYRVVSNGPVIYFSGGEYGRIGRSQWNSDLWRYDPFVEEWEKLSQLDKPFRHHSACFIPERDLLVIFGGYGQFRVMKSDGFIVNLKTGKVDAEFDLNLPGNALALCSFKGDALLFQGGYLYRSRDFSNWNKVKMIKDCNISSLSYAVSDNHHVYLIDNGTPHLFRIDPDGDMKLECIGSFVHEAQNICLLDGVIYNFVSDKFDTRSYVEAYDIATATFSLLWSKRTKMQFSSYFSLGCFPLVLI